MIPDDCLQETGMTAIELRAAEAEMRLHPSPDAVQVPYQEDVVWNRAYRRMVGHVVIYDAPNGNPIGELDAGYNYVKWGFGFGCCARRAGSVKKSWHRISNIKMTE